MKLERLLKTEEDIWQFLWWVGLLEAGIFERGTGHLQYRDTFCCLGVGIMCMTEDESKHRTHRKILDGPIEISGGTPTGEGIPLWLKLVNDDFVNKYKNAVNGEVRNKTLVNLNDHDMLTHPEIAGRLMKAYEKELDLSFEYPES